MSRYDDLKSAKETVRILASQGNWSAHALACKSLKAVKEKAWCRGCGDYQNECSCDSRQEVRR